ncbi:MAG: glycosyltransferase, partial [Burkholderiales bacterium]|nr:glycosyltransferase [Burkholderiales bacterium]
MTNTSAATIVINGMALLQAGNLREADQCFRNAYALDQRSVQSLIGLGIVAQRTGNFALAIEFFDRAIKVDPSIAAAHVNRGNALSASQHDAMAVAAFEQALVLSPELPSALINMATALHAMGRLDDAVEALERARMIEPNAPELLNNLGNFYKDQGRLNLATACYQGALALNPMLQQAFSNKLAALKVDAALTQAQILDQHRQWSNWFEAVSTHAPLLINTPEPSRRLRVGYVSPDCHTALPAFIDPVIAAHDRGQFEIFCYFNNPQSSEKLNRLNITNTTRAMRGMDDQQVATQIHTDGIDILIDIAGHTGHNRLGVFARRPAPVQMTWLDYLCTTGLRAMDYRITDAVADPAGNEAFHSEKLLRVPHTQWCWQPDANTPDLTPLPAVRRGHVTFGSFNNAQKLTDPTLALWRQLLNAMPDAALRVAGVPEGVSRTRVIEALACDPSRLVFLPRMSLVDYHAAFGEVDIALDPMPFSGATTTLDALRQGVPVLTLPTERSCSRSTASLLTALKLTDWIASDETDFVVRAQRLAADSAGLSALRATMRDRLHASPIMDTSGFTRNLESLFRQAWRTWCEQRLANADQPGTLSGSDAGLQCARTALNAGQHDEALALLAPILKRRPQWELAKRELVRACMAWSRANPQYKPAWQAPFVALEMRQKISAIICSIRPDYFAALRDKLTQQFARHDFEVIGIYDAKSLCEGYNRGAAMAGGEWLIFCHDDIDFATTDFGERLLWHLDNHDVVGVAGASRLVDADWGHAGLPNVHGQIIHKPQGQEDYLYFCAGLQAPIINNMQALDGVFIAMHREVWETIRFDEATFDGFHIYDIDFTYRAHLAGYDLVVPLD